MKRIAPPFLAVALAAFPLLSLFAHNQTDVEVRVLWLPLTFTVIGALALFGLFLLVTRQAAKAGVLASLVVTAFFYYGLFFDQRPTWFIAPWLAVLALTAIAVLRTRRDLANLTLIVAVGASVMVVPRAATIVTYHARHPSIAATDGRLWPTALTKPSGKSGDVLPDIYVIIPDDYARADVLQQYFHYDNSAFVGELKRRGFVVSDQSRSPYSDSESNIASTLNMDYLTNFPRVLGKNSQDVRLIQRVSADNRAARLLASIGYEYIHLDTDEVTFSGGNPDVSPLAAPDSFTNLWMRKSILKQVGGPLGFNQAATDARFRRSVRSGFSRLAALPAGTEPKFVVFHTLLPHDPYVFGAGGAPVSYSAHSDADLSSQVGRSHYLRQLEFTSRNLLDSVDRIRAHATTPPVIVIQSDEGFQAEPRVFGKAAMQDIRVKGLSALYLPGLDEPGVPNPPNTVNTLRFVFNRYLGTRYEMLESVSYVEGDRPYNFPEISVK